LVKFAARSGKFTVEQAFELTDKVFDLMAKANIYDSKKPWNFIDNTQAQRDENGQFKRK
jgi:hypothetical protein